MVLPGWGQSSLQCFDNVNRNGIQPVKFAYDAQRFCSRTRGEKVKGELANAWSRGKLL